MKTLPIVLPILLLGLISCDDDKQTSEQELNSDWLRNSNNPVLRDIIPEANYQVASDPHVFYDEEGLLYMVYSGDVNGTISIKLAKGTALNQWETKTNLLSEVGPSGKDVNKETAFYRKASNGKHQLYYIGYEDETTYQAEVYLAEADQLEGPYTQMNTAVVPRGNLAGKEVYLITSPSVVEHQGELCISFIGWNNSPEEVSEVWIIGATSSDEGHTWSDFQIVDTPIGMEGQVTKVSENEFVAVRTAPFQDEEAIYYATASHPFGPWEEFSVPILTRQEPELEKNEIIAPQITVDPSTGQEYLFYTGADHQAGWWIMLAERQL